MKNFVKIIILIFILQMLLVLQTTVFSQMKKDTAEYIYPFDILITAPRLSLQLKESPFATSIINTGILNTMPRSISVDEPLKLVPGLKIDNQADGERVHLSIRGQGILSERGIRGIKVLLDGIPLNDPTGFTPDFYDVDWPGVEKIEVLRGPAASLYGGSSSSGIINIMTGDILQKPVGGKVFLSSGTFNTWKAFGKVGTGFKQGNAFVSFSKEMGDGYRVHTHYWADKIWSKLNWNVTKNIYLQPVFGYVNFYNENAEGLNRQQVSENPRQPNGDAIPKHEYIQTSRFTGGLKGDITVNKNQSVSFTGFIRGTKYSESVPSQVISRKMTAPGGSLQYNLKMPGRSFTNHLSIGGDIQYQEIEASSKANLGGSIEGPDLLSDYTVKQTGMGAFLLDRLEFSAKWSAMLCLRYDQMTNKLTDNLKNPVDLSGDKNFNRATGRIGLTYTPAKNMNIYANWGMGFLPPATEELIANPDAFGGFNQNLTFATSQGPELGIRSFIGKKLYFDLAGYYLETKDDFDRFRVPSRPYETFYTNAGQSRRIGAELFAKITPCERINFQFAYTYSNFKYTSSDPIKIIMDDTTIHKFIEKDNFLPNSPEHQFIADLDIMITRGFNIGFTSETYSRSYIDGANLVSESVGGYTLWGARLVYKTLLMHTSTEISVNARNIFGKSYIAFTEPDPGGNSYQPGTPLEVFLNARIGF
ncbi:MAG: TonB-dependent receptor [Ignavibacteria bacterium]